MEANWLWMYAVLIACICEAHSTTTCQGTECILEDLQTTTDTQLLQNLTAAIAKVLQSQPNIHITHDYQNCSRVAPADDTPADLLSLPKDCTEIFSSGNATSGQYKISPRVPHGLYDSNPGEPVNVYCDMDTDGGGWTVFQRRHNGLVDFYRDWEDYKQGFGYADGDYWLGLQNLHQMTSTAQYELRIDLEDFSRSTAYAKYNSFKIGEERLFFKLMLGDYEGTAGDSLTYHNYRYFSTRDQDHDKWGRHCAQQRHGAWWYNACVYSNLNALYHGPSQTDITGMVWYHWKNNNEVLKASEMKIRHIG